MSKLHLNKIILPLSMFIYNKDEYVNPDILDRILVNHFYPMNQIAHSTNINHIVCHRTKNHEKRKGREKGKNGRQFWSEHTFEKSSRQIDGLGATDVSGESLPEIAELLLRNTEYTRFAIYIDQNFIHCDYAFPERGRRFFDGSWNQLSESEYLNIIGG